MKKGGKKITKSQSISLCLGINKQSLSGLGHLFFPEENILICKNGKR